MDDKKIGERIKKWRKIRKLTQKDLADKIKKNIKSIQRYETGINPVQIDVLNSIANALKVELSTLLPKESIFNPLDDFKYDYMIKLILSMGYTIREIQAPSGYRDRDGNLIDDFEPLLLIRKGNKELQLDVGEIGEFFKDIEKYITFIIDRDSTDGSFLDDKDLEPYMTDEQIAKIKTKLGYDGDEYIEPLDFFEKAIWEKWKSINHPKDEK